MVQVGVQTVLRPIFEVKINKFPHNSLLNSVHLRFVSWIARDNELRLAHNRVLAHPRASSVLPSIQQKRLLLSTATHRLRIDPRPSLQVL